jgi:hypothetical protein
MIQYIIAGAIGFVVAKIFEEDEALKYSNGGQVDMLKSLFIKNGFTQNELDIIIEENENYFNQIEFYDNETLIVYRALDLPRKLANDFIKLNQKEIGEGIGEYWTFDKNLQNAIWGEGQYEAETYLVQCKGHLNINDIDWEMMKYAFNDDIYHFSQESEIRGVNGGNSIKVIECSEIYSNGGSVLLAPNGKPSNLTPEQYKLVRTPEFKAWFGDWENDPENSSKVVDFNGEPLVVYHGTDVKFNQFDLTKVGEGSDLLGKGIYLTENKKVAEFYANLVAKKRYIKKYEEGILGSENPIYEDDASKKAKKHEIIYDFFINAKNIVDINELGVDKKTKEIIVNSIRYMFQDKSENYVNERIDFAIKNKHNIKNYRGLIIYLIEQFPDAKNQVVEYLKNKYDGFIFEPTSNFEISEIDYQNYVVFNPNQIKLADGTNTTFDGNNPDIRFDGGGDVKELSKKQKKEIILIQNKVFADGLPRYKLSADGTWVMALDVRTNRYKSYQDFNSFYDGILEMEREKYARENAQKVFEYLDDSGAELLNKSIYGSRYYIYKNNHIRVSNHDYQSQQTDRETGLPKYKYYKHNFYSYEKDGWQKMISEIESLKNPDIRYDGGGEISKDVDSKLKELGFVFNNANYRYGKTINKQDYITAFYDKTKGLYKIRGVHKFKTPLGENSVGIQFDFDNEKEFYNKINEYLN